MIEKLGKWGSKILLLCSSQGFVKNSYTFGCYGPHRTLGRKVLRLVAMIDNLRMRDDKLLLCSSQGFAKNSYTVGCYDPHRTW